MSDINEVGSTAFFIAGIREKEKDQEHPLFEDPYAEFFVTDQVREQVHKVFAALPDGMELIRYRSFLFDDIVRREIGNGVRQVVVLGAGFDMRALMFQTEGVRFCDVDQPAVLAFKSKVLQGRGLTPCAAVPCNYLEVDLPGKLAEVGFDLNAAVLFVWEGNTMYLPEDLIHGFLSGLRGRMPSFKIAFDYFSRQVIDRTSGNDEVTAVTDMFEKTLNVKWVTGFDDLGALAERTGLKVAESGNLWEVGQRAAPGGAAALAKLAGLYAYGILSHGAA